MFSVHQDTIVWREDRYHVQQGDGAVQVDWQIADVMVRVHQVRWLLFLYIFFYSLLTQLCSSSFSSLSSSLPLSLPLSLSPGYVCGVGEILPALTKCGGSTKICPEGSTTSAPVHEGYYSIGGNDENTRISEIRCGPGFWCANGTKRECAPGVYGTKFGHTLSECDAPCPEGFFCPAGTVSPIPCGRVDQYCPIGSFIPTQVEKGYHTTREDVLLPILRAERVG